MICYDDNNKIMYLHTKATTYAFGFWQGVPVHLYWGKRLNHPVDSELCEIFKNQEDTKLYGYFGDVIPYEYPTFGSCDLRSPALHTVYNDGSTVTKLVLKDIDIIDLKPKLEGLPATYCEEGDNVKTVVLHLCDDLKEVSVDLSYSVFEDLDAITRSVKITNQGEPITLDTVLSASVDFDGAADMELLHLDGAWSRERKPVRTPITCGNVFVDSKGGASSHYYNPFIALCEKDADEDKGNVYGFNLVYSGNFVAGAHLDTLNSIRAYIGINPFGFNFLLKTGESFQSPEAVLVFSPDGIGGMSRIYHKLYRTRLVRGKYRDSSRFVVMNTWENVWYSYNEDILVDIAKESQKFGVDMLVVDDGWYGKRDDSLCSLGDWKPNPEKLPNGFDGLAKRINALGMHLGVWMEPEMVSTVSDFYNTHPDWILSVKDREPTAKRKQYVLDLTREDVQNYIIDSVSNILSSANIEYLKWDMNRYMTEVGSLSLPAERQGEIYHRYILGLYRIFEEIVSRFPNVLFEGCASGGGRFDPGILHYMPQIWTSDETDGIDRCEIQYGTSIVYPYSCMSAHVSIGPVFSTGRNVNPEMRANIALPCQYGYEFPYKMANDEIRELLKKKTEQHRELEDVFFNGLVYRLVSPFENDFSALEFVAEDGEKAVFFISSISPQPTAEVKYVKLRGLDRDAYYRDRDSDIVYGGDYLMDKGIRFRNSRQYDQVMIVFERI